MAQGLKHLAFGRATDAVKLLLRGENMTAAELERLDLFNLAAAKRSTGGVSEIKLFDRLKALERLAAYTGPQAGAQNDFITALINSTREEEEDEDDIGG